MSAEFDNIPTHEALPPNTGEGFGVSDTKLNTVKAADILDQPLAVTGYLTMDNQYKKKDEDPDKVTLFEVMDATGELSGCSYHQMATVSVPPVSQTMAPSSLSAAAIVPALQLSFSTEPSAQATYRG